MLLLGLQGSPRLKGNTSCLLSSFLETGAKLGARTKMIEVDKNNIVPCKEYVLCEKKGFCPIDDDMKHEIYGLIREAEVIVAATPIFFYNMTAQLKALVDRCQALWALKYRFRLKDPASGQRKGFLLSVGATRGKNLFEGLELSARYFFDAVDARYEGSLTYKGIEHPGDIKNHPTAKMDVESAAEKILKPLLCRKKVLFVDGNNDCMSQMAKAFTQIGAGDRLDVFSSGDTPASKLDSFMVKAMEEKKIDVKFQKPRATELVLSENEPEVIVRIGNGAILPVKKKVLQVKWDIDQPKERSMESMRKLRDDIEKRVFELVENITP